MTISQKNGKIKAGKRKRRGEAGRRKGGVRRGGVRRGGGKKGSKQKGKGVSGPFPLKPPASLALFLTYRHFLSVFMTISQKNRQ